jgi:hypothetical protein
MMKKNALSEDGTSLLISRDFLFNPEWQNKRERCSSDPYD